MILIVFRKNILEITLTFVVGGSKLTFFVKQILNFVVAFILERREYMDQLKM